MPILIPRRIHPSQIQIMRTNRINRYQESIGADLVTAPPRPQREVVAATEAYSFTGSNVASLSIGHGSRW